MYTYNEHYRKCEGEKDTFPSQTDHNKQYCCNKIKLQI